MRRQRACGPGLPVVITPAIPGSCIYMSGVAPRLRACSICRWTIKRLYLVHLNFAAGCMRYSTQIKPISYLKANAAEVLQDLNEQRRALVITQNGEAKAVIQDVASYEEAQETMALLKMLTLGNQQTAQGRVKPVAQVAKQLRGRNTKE